MKEIDTAIKKHTLILERLEKIKEFQLILETEYYEQSTDAIDEIMLCIEIEKDHITDLYDVPTCIESL